MILETKKMDKHVSLLQEKLADNRSKKVVFISHCLLNENTRYLGGAFRQAGVDELIDYLQQQGIGIVQMKCPEQKCWGGILKKDILKGYGINGTFLNALRKPFVRFFINRTKAAYSKLAREVVYEIDDYIKSGCEVVGIIGIDGSPSCGVKTSLDLISSSESAANINVETLNSNTLNEEFYNNCLKKTEGLFIEQLEKHLNRKGLKINLYSHDLINEMNGEKTKIEL